MSPDRNNTSVYTSAAREADPVQAVVTRVFGIMGMGLTLSGVVAYITIHVQALLSLAFNAHLFLALGTVGLAFYLSYKARDMAPNVAMGWFLLYAALNGIWLAPVLLLYAQATVAQAFFTAAGMFVAMAAWGYYTRKDLTAIGSLGAMGVIGIIIASVVNWFVQSGTLSLVISYLAVGIFIGLTAYDTQKIKTIARQGGMRGGISVVCALSLYLDFIILFLHLMRILGGRRS